MFDRVIMKPEKTLQFVLPVTCQTQEAETEIKSLWTLYSDGLQSEKMVGLHPKKKVIFSFQAKVFITGNKQGPVRGFEIQGELGERNCSILVLCS